MSRSYPLPTLSDEKVQTRVLSTEELQKHVEDHAGRLATLEGTFTRTDRIPLTRFTKDGAWKDALADTAGSNLLGLADANGSPLLGTAASGGGTAHPVEKAVASYVLPDDYKAATNLTVRVRAKLAGAVQVAGKVDLEAFLQGDGSLGSDICATAIQTITGDDTYADFDFTITGASLTPGAIVVFRVTLDVDDTGGTASKAASIASVAVLRTGQVSQ